MSREKQSESQNITRRRYTDEFKDEAVQMILDGHSAASVAERLGLSGTNILYRWKQQRVARSGVVAGTLEGRVKELESELRRVERERDVLKKRWPFSTEVCDILDVSRSAFYSWNREVENRDYISISAIAGVRRQLVVRFSDN